MIDINLLKDDDGIKLVRESQAKRSADPALVDRTLALYKEWTAAQFELNNLQKEVNAIQKAITAKRKAKENADAEMAQKKALDAKVAETKPKVAEAEETVRKEARKIGNIVDDEIGTLIDPNHPEQCRVPATDNEDDNLIVATYGNPEMKTDIMSHDEVMYRLEMFDADRGVKVVGHRGYFLTGDGVDLNQALISYALDFLKSRPYTKPAVKEGAEPELARFKKVQTPFFMKKELMAKTAQLEEFDEALYGIREGDEVDKYLIATSEQPISAFHSGEWFEKPSEQLPKMYAGYSTCFRKEAGSHGKDMWGIFRVHQFEKIEQFCITEPDQSRAMLAHMLANSRAFYESLGIPYRVVAIVTGALNNAAATKFDLEAWFPFQREYKELVSCSNCTDYQSRELEVRCGVKKNDGKKVYCHMLNGTLCATERALCCLVENYQTPEGLNIPKALQPYMGGQTFIPYSRELPAKKAGKK